ncbi:hypothetical protein [Neorhizobium sp. T6_25]|uniref:hypothetical protein n=1 Tax=Neorhizobium sp. T6_25 TaxID=2093833 RepID=UPI00155E3A36|nr:hypothetical protein [Neorhizobium sp. T6_25]
MMVDGCFATSPLRLKRGAKRSGRKAVATIAMKAMATPSQIDPSRDCRQVDVAIRRYGITTAA